MRFVKTFFLAVSSSFVLTWRTEHVGLHGLRAICITQYGPSVRAPRYSYPSASVCISSIRSTLVVKSDVYSDGRFVTTASERPRRNSASFSLSASLSTNEYDAASPPS